MKKSIIALLLLGSFTACNNKVNPEIGGQKDEYGCLSAAGETWSELRQSCIQVFNEGLRLNPIITSDNDAVISAFLLESEDKKTMEIFLPSGETQLLPVTAEGVYEKKKYKYIAEEQALYIDNVIKYKG
ncbi:hypothetical protein AB4865_05890 [Capnocytophaga sp. ARDL2]|uniref:hypothetical protein n=1 Tax=Capnocytophaga sp. ARDL2 TaxID=3238809 RepID=UPI003558C586